MVDARVVVTGENVNQLSAFINRWADIGLDKQNYDSYKVDTAINELYINLGFKPPEYIVHLESPLHCYAVYSVLLNGFTGSLSLDDKIILLKDHNFSGIMNNIDDKAFQSIVESFKDVNINTITLNVSSSQSQGRAVIFQTPDNKNILHLIDKNISLSLQSMITYDTRIAFLKGFYEIAYLLIGKDYKKYSLSNFKLVNQLNTKDRYFDSVVRSSLSGKDSEVFIKIIQDAIFYGFQEGIWLGFYEFLRDLSISNRQFDKLKYLMPLAEYCGWFIPLNNICLVSSKPEVISIKEVKPERFELHAEGCPALKYPGGYEVWAYNGVVLNESRYHCHPNRWEAGWLLTEQNAEIRRVIFQALGSSRVLSELNAEFIDSYVSTVQGNYELYKIAQPLEPEDYHILKMTCPSTGFIHAIRVPSDIETARDAIKWINHDIDPENFIDSA